MGDGNRKGEQTALQSTAKQLEHRYFSLFRQDEASLLGVGSLDFWFKRVFEPSQVRRMTHEKHLCTPPLKCQ